MTWRSESTTIASITAIMKETIFTTITLNAADLGLPAPSSLLTLTLFQSNSIQALKVRNNYLGSSMIYVGKT